MIVIPKESESCTPSELQENIQKLIFDAESMYK